MLKVLGFVVVGLVIVIFVSVEDMVEILKLKLCVLFFVIVNVELMGFGVVIKVDMFSCFVLFVLRLVCENLFM